MLTSANAVSASHRGVDSGRIHDSTAPIDRYSRTCTRYHINGCSDGSAPSAVARSEGSPSEPHAASKQPDDEPDKRTRGKSRDNDPTRVSIGGDVDEDAVHQTMTSSARIGSALDCR